MSRSSGGLRPVGRHIILVAGLLAALVVPLATASADIGGPPEGSGRTLYLQTESVCGATDCTSIALTTHEADGVVQGICVDTTKTSLDGQTWLGGESVCVEDVGAWLTFAGFVTGVQDTSVPLNGGTSTISGSSSLVGMIIPSTEVIEDSFDGCTFTWTVKERNVAVSGAVILDGVSYPTTDGLSTVRSLKTKTRC